ncbi:MAG: ATP-grasp domain-containing protein [Candidatus Jordarchaeaceae archaeon]
MVENQSTVLVLGFNARPIVSSAKRLGLKVLVVDYWGDVDIYKYADEVLVVSELDKEPDTAKNHASLFLELAQKLAKKHQIDFILVGSGFDDQFQVWEELKKIAPIMGNTSENIKKSRDKISIYREAEKLGIQSPNSIIVKSVEDAVEAAELIGLPVVVRPTKGGGGQGIHLAKNIKEVERMFQLLSNQRNVMIQEYIRGIDASCSLLSNGTSALVVSINEQLIGLSELGAKDFIYCGNIVPLKTTEQVYKKIKDASENLIELLNLKGSNGIDYVIRRGEPYLLEINPRFQGTLECVEMVTGLNIVESHIEACQGILPKNIPKSKGYAVKNILFAKHDFIMPEITIPDVFDITKPGTVIRGGKPACTIQIHTSTRSGALFKAKRLAERIYSEFEKTRLNT